MMKISLVMPSNRSTYPAIAHAIEWASLDPSKFEVIVRDNSENEKKREMLSRIDSPTLKLHIVPHCSMTENGVEALRLATGEYVFYVGDDDWISTRGLEQIHALASQNEHDTSVSCAIGDYMVESSAATGFFRYSGLDAADSTARIANYLAANATNFLNYAVVRRPLALFCYDFIGSVPYKFSYDDQLLSLLYLRFGRVLQTNRVFYGYDLSDWETAEKSLAKDRAFYVAAGLPKEYDRLHHLFCGLEGALLMESDMVAARAPRDSGNAAELWFRTMFAKFRGHNREVGYSNNTANAVTLKLKDKLLALPQLDMHETLLDVCEALEIADAEGAQRYFQFWSTL